MTGSNERNSSDIYLVDFFIYCPLLCEKEGQEGRKILYYYPSDVDIDRQILEVGYCEGLVRFTETFGFDAPCETVHFQKTRLLFYQIDHDICFAMTIHVPATERKKDDKYLVEYLDENVNDRLMLPVLKMSYQYFVLQYGSLFAILHYEGVEKLKTILQKHFDKFIEYHLNTMINNVNIDSSYFGLQFLPISTKDYLKTQSILRRLESRCSALRETFLLFKDQIIWSGLNQYDTTLLYSFFRLYYWPHIQLLENTSTIQYITIDSNAIPDEELIASVDIISQEFYLGELFLPFRIFVVHLNSFTLFCIFNHDEYLPDHEIIPSITEILEKDFNTMLPEFEECARTKYPTTDTLVKSVYFNKSNMAHATTIDWKQEPHNNITGIMNTISEDLQWFPSSGELLVKRENDPWIVAKRSDMRELIVTVNQKNANLKEISDKIKQIFSTEFNNIFLLE